MCVGGGGDKCLPEMIKDSLTSEIFSVQNLIEIITSLKCFQLMKHHIWAKIVLIENDMTSSTPNVNLQKIL